MHSLHIQSTVGAAAHAGCWCLCTCRELQSFMLQHNCLSALPLSMYSLTALKTLDVSYNRPAQLQHEIGNMEGLQVSRASGAEAAQTLLEATFQLFNMLGSPVPSCVRPWQLAATTAVLLKWQGGNQAHCRGLM